MHSYYNEGITLGVLAAGKIYFKKVVEKHIKEKAYTSVRLAGIFSMICH